MNTFVIAAVIIAIIVRVVVQKGSFILPTVYKEGNNVRFNWGSIGVIVIAIVSVLGTGYFDPSLYTSPITAFFAAYSLPALSDAIATYALPGSDEDNIVFSMSEYVENESNSIEPDVSEDGV